MTNTGRVVALVLLVALSDYLIFGHSLGLNLCLFFIGLGMVLLVSARKRLALHSKLALAGVSILGSLPLLETASLSAILLGMIATMVVALVCAGLAPRRPVRLHFVLLRFAVVLPLPFLGACRRLFQSSRHRSSLTAAGRSIGLWLLPLALASVFLVLFAMANPLIEQALRDIDLTFLLRLLNIRRIGFWLLVAAGVWAMLRPRLARRNAGSVRPESYLPTLESPLFSQASLLRSLLAFNALFAIQSLLDIVYLWGGAELPDGMTHAEYAHRGAYPLIATALLAAVFVLMTMTRGGPGDRSPLIRGLVFAWIAQNVLLCVSSLLRLDLYVETYSLTGLRVAAGIWMGLVAVGLVLIMIRIILRYTNEWLVAMNLAAVVCVLYASTLVDLPAFIARFNVLHSREVSNEGVMLDLYYLSSLGPSAIPAIDLYMTSLTSRGPGYAVELRKQADRIRGRLAFDFEQHSMDWRSWTIRAARLETYLHLPTTIATLQQNEDNGTRQYLQDR